MSAGLAQTSGASEKIRRPKKRGNLFIVDLPTFAKVCDLGDADAAAAYLIIAAGTGADNRTSTWSREAINKRTALNWRKANAAMSKLEQHGLLVWLDGKGTRKPKIALPTVETRDSMTPKMVALAQRLEEGDQPHSPSDIAVAREAQSRGWFKRDEAGSYEFVRDRPLVKAFLPNELAGEGFGPHGLPSTCIIDRVRMSRDPMALRLMVDLYAQQDLAEHGGINDHYLFREFDRQSAFATGSMTIWEFCSGSQQARVGGHDSPFYHHWRKPSITEEKAGKNGAADFYQRLGILEDAGAVEWVNYLVEDEESNASRIYPVSVVRHGKIVWSELESVIGSYASRAALALSNDPAADDGMEESAGRYLLPASRQARKATLRGVPRLRHRARTSNAARWRKEMQEEATALIDTFRAIIADKAPSLLAEADRRLADFNAASTESSTIVQRDINDTSQSGRHGSVSLRETTPLCYGDAANDASIGQSWLRSHGGL